MRVIAAATLAAILFVPTIAIADQDQPAATQPAVAPAATPADAQQADTSGRDQIICKTEPPTTGTRLGGGRECHTQQEWDDRMHQTQKALQKMQNGPFCRYTGC